jgi:hypothetical protein
MEDLGSHMVDVVCGWKATQAMSRLGDHAHCCYKAVGKGLVVIYRHYTMLDLPDVVGHCAPFLIEENMRSQ